MLNFHPYLRLMRFDKPVGIILLWIPTAWALWMAYQGTPPLGILMYFFVGTIVLRAAGCVINDIADRHIDKEVMRTRDRPLATGEVTRHAALLLLSLLLAVALLIVLQLPRLCFYESFLALLVTFIYPFCKRWLSAPQLVLGVAFSMGIPMAYAAAGVAWTMSALMLWLLNIAWVVCYDTMYAMVDRDDDVRIGVKSTAVWFGSYDRLIVGLLQVFFHGIWAFLAIFQHYSVYFWLFWVVAAAVLWHQQRLLSQRCINAYFSAFLESSIYGVLMWGALFTA